MNIYDIAKKAGVSTATVSRVINGNTNVSEKSRKKILDVIEQEGYIPNVFARGLSLNTIKTVGILCPVISDINHALPVSFLERLLRQNGFDTLLTCSGSNEEDKTKYLELLLNKRVDAIFVIGSTEKELAENGHFVTAAKHIPIVIVNGFVPVDNVYCVLCDEETATCEMVQTLYRQGHEKILYIYDTATYSGYQKLQGYYKGVGLCGIEADPELILKVEDLYDSMDMVKASVNDLICSKVNFSAVLAADDLLAIGALKALRIHKMEAMPIIGFNNSMHGRTSNPELTTIDNMIEVQCNAAVNLLMDVLNGKSATSKMMISAKVIQRETFKF